MQKLRLNKKIELRSLGPFPYSHPSPLRIKLIWDALRVPEQGEVKARRTWGQNGEPQSWKVLHLRPGVTGPYSAHCSAM